VPEETGLGADAALARETALTESVRVPGEADRVVVPTLQAAYESALRGRRQLDAIGADIESAVANQQTLALDTPAGAANFSRFLAAKTQDVNRVVVETAAESQARDRLLRMTKSALSATATKLNELLVDQAALAAP
jgi:Domain of unknown function (DUF4226)